MTMSGSLTDAATAASQPPCSTVKALYFLTAVADPNLLARLLEPFAKLGFVPDRIHADRAAHQERDLQLDIRISGIDTHSALLIEKKLRAVIGVRSLISLTEAQEISIKKTS